MLTCLANLEDWLWSELLLTANRKKALASLCICIPARCIKNSKSVSTLVQWSIYFLNWHNICATVIINRHFQRWRARCRLNIHIYIHVRMTKDGHFKTFLNLDMIYRSNYKINLCVYSLSHLNSTMVYEHRAISTMNVNKNCVVFIYPVNSPFDRDYWQGLLLPSIILKDKPITHVKFYIIIKKGCTV